MLVSNIHFVFHVSLSLQKCQNQNFRSSDIKTVVQLAFTLLQGIYRSLKSIGKSHPTGENNLPVYSNGVCLSLIDLLNWINITLKPSIDLIKTSCLTNRQSSSDWYHIARLTELLIEQFNQLHVLLTTSNSSSTDESLQMNIDNQRILMNNKFILSKCWLLIGCLYLRCIRPESHLDPYLVMQIEEEDIEYEVSKLFLSLSLPLSLCLCFCL
ncbi:unnamed protein product [Trichobilharzia regenti]|nr:unnamed protein product [Trichobilharzia regenti]